LITDKGNNSYEIIKLESTRSSRNVFRKGL